FIIQEYVEKWDDTGFILALLASVFLAYRSLMDHLGAVEKALLKNNIDEARREVSKIVGRDTRTLDKNAIARASIESVAENFSDGVVAPVFWFLVAGLPGIVTYKMINTADSMIGNRSKRFEHFGWASAKIDDVANYLPARLSFLIIICAGWISATGNIKSGILTAYNFHHKHASPNAGWPEATMAGILNVRLGGPRFYQNGNRKDNAWLGIGRDVEIMDLIIALTLINFSWIIILIALIIGAMI
ncbi:MAG: cobalamin biosynthesis protein CobD, partial [Kordiimonadaceae bacterium]|nr:cobalamin biosynthesis protein CobD [Kordiimonadaceae bacterium]